MAPPASVPHPRIAVLLVLCAFALAGVLVVDDYGVNWDETAQRDLGVLTAAYIGGGYDVLLQHRDRAYGVAFEMPLLIIELMLGLEDMRSVHLTRHILSHMFFLVGGGFCYLLAHRMFGSRLVALLVMLMFLLQPRLYAHSFFNTKDVPFLSMFMIVLFLMHRAFRRGDAAAFIACGMAVGVLTGVRILGVMLFAVVLGLRLLDLLQAGDWRARRRILATSGLFAAASMLALYAVWPYLWGDPFGRFAEAFLFMSVHPELVASLFQGSEYIDRGLPAHYVPGWMAVTTPPVTLLFAAVGLLVALGRACARPEACLRNGALRFELLPMLCMALPVAVVVSLDSNLYNDWRQLYFLHAPLVLLAGVGLHWLLGAAGAWRRAACGLAVAGLALAAAPMVLLHPNQALYFNFLVDRRTPERLRSQYDMDYYGMTLRQGLEHLLESRTGPVSVDMFFGDVNAGVLPAADRQRVQAGFDDRHADFHVTSYRVDDVFAPFIHSLKIYGSTVMGVAALDLALVDEARRRPRLDVLRAVAGRPPVARSRYDVHIMDGRVVYANKDCRSQDTRPLFHLRIVPADPADLPDHRKPFGHERRWSLFGAVGARFGDECMAVMSLPDYGVARIDIGQSMLVTDRFGRRGLCPVWREAVLFDERREARRCAPGSPGCAVVPTLPVCRQVGLDHPAGGRPQTELP